MCAALSSDLEAASSSHDALSWLNSKLTCRPRYAIIHLRHLVHSMNKDDEILSKIDSEFCGHPFKENASAMRFISLASLELYPDSRAHNGVFALPFPLLRA